ncbi:ABC transporter ATP-binding protein [Ruicaihuangia caeni]|uniref:ABC transporter ATP-binding protein n=1 Tax=Ruicaihuangia caeni TaxID=3042517 RepID=A0AAW6T735_9MICO|nr:ABC transporter ATP-binding protein [Klugiella sp. YN-L-19]MDI2097623.1 ABC transporter ATP-binding protein [Klugiella sp. YN-L-19]
MRATTRTIDMPLAERKERGRAKGAALRLEAVRKVYGDNIVANDVTLDIEPGEFVTLLGASGSGKTTLLRMIAGFLEPTAGVITIDGKDVTSVPVHKRKIGVVFQNYALFPHMNVLKNVMFPLEMHKVPKVKRKELARDALAAVKLENFEDRMPSQLSGGQQQRVALARAIVMKPRLLLMDEPLGALDRRLREAMQLEILKLSRELGLTVINVTHDQEEAFTMSDKIALLADGTLIQYDEPAALYSAPVSEVAAEFLGESNRFEGQLVHEQQRWFVRADDIEVELTASAADGFAEGDRVVAVIRPWSISLSSADSDEQGSVGTVSALIYAGESQKVLVETPLGREFIVRRSLDSADEQLHEGQLVQLSWRPDHVVITRPR